MMLPRSVTLSLATTLLASAGLLIGMQPMDRQDNPVYVDDSPLAWELFQRARDQAEENTGEAIRLYQELLDDYAARALPDHPGATSHFRSVRRQVLTEITRHDGLRERYELMATPEARRLFEAGDLETLARTRSLTEPGLDALLILAQREIEAAWFRRALSRLTEAVRHPHLDDQRAAHAWFMLGVAAIHLEDNALVRRAADELEARGAAAETLAQRLQEMRDGPPPPPMRRAVTVHDKPRVSGLGDLVAEEIWSTELNQALYTRLDDERTRERPMVQRAIDQVVREGGMLTVAPAAMDDVVYVNQGHTVLAVDRFTGSPVWTRPFEDRPPHALVEREGDAVLDMNVIAVDEDALVTLTGHALSTRRSNQGRVVCLDPTTGRLRWAVRVDRLGTGDEFDGLFPHGAPIIADGAAYVLARRVSPQSLTSAYLICLDLATGDLRWIRHVVSSGSLRRSPRAFDSPVYRDSSVYVASAVGAVARFDAANGHPHWVHRFPVPINPTSLEQMRRPWEIAEPVVLEDRVLALQSGHRRLVVLDRETGALLESHETTGGEGWNSPAYLLGGREFVYGIGRDIRAFHPENLNEPAWRFPLPSMFQQSRDGRPGGEPDAGRHLPDGPVFADSRLDVRGRVQIVRSLRDEHSWQLIVPALQGLVLVNASDGMVEHHLPLEEPGNPLAIDSQLLIAGNEHLKALLSLPDAERMLRERLASVSDDPKPALALLRLAVRAGDIDLALEASGLVEEVATRLTGRSAAEVREQLFSMLLDVSRQVSQAGWDLPATGTAAARADADIEPADREHAEALFAALERATDTTRQRLAYLLTYGDWLASGEHHAAGEKPGERAIRVWQRILEDPELAWSMVRVAGDGPIRHGRGEGDHERSGGLLRPGRTLVLDRLAAMLDEDEGLRAWYESRASAALAGLSPRDASGLVELAALWPGSSASASALIDAAPEASENGRARTEAVRAVGRLAGWARAAGGLKGARADGGRGAHFRVLAAAAGIAREHGLEELSRSMLVWLAEGGLDREVALEPGGEARPVRSWLAEARPGHATNRWSGEAGHRAVSSGVLPRLGGQRGPAVARDGVVVRWHPAARGGVGGDVGGGGDAGILLVEPGVLTSHEADGRQRSVAEQWSVAWDDEFVRLIGADAGWYVLYSALEPGGAVLRKVDRASGEVVWRVRLDEQAFGRPAANRPVAGFAGAAVRSGVLPVMGSSEVVAVRRDGALAAFSLADGERVWSASTAMDEVHHAFWHEGLVVLVGWGKAADRSGGGAGAGSGGGLRAVLDVSDGRTGKSVHGQLLGLHHVAGISRVEPVGRGVVVCFSETGVEGYDVYSGRTLWVNDSRPLREVSDAVVAGGLVVVAGGDELLRSIDVYTGRASRPFARDLAEATGEDAEASREWDGGDFASLHTDGRTVWARYEQRIVSYEPDGTLLGRDVITGERTYQWLVPGDDRIVVVSMVPPIRERMPDRRSRTRYEYRLYTFSAGMKALDDAVRLPLLAERIENVAATDGFLLMSTSRQTIVIPFPQR